MCNPGAGADRNLIPVRVAVDEIELDAGPTSVTTLLRSTWRVRELIQILARKNFYVRYRRASLGMLWAVGLPLLQALVMAVIFSRFRRGEAPGGSFAAYLLAGYVIWSFFSNVVSSGATSIVDGAALSSRIYFPRMALPVVAVVTNLYGLAATVVVMSTVAIGLRGSIEPTLPILVPAVLLTVVLAGSLSLLLAALHVYFRDVRYMVTAAMQPWFFLTPVLWSSEQMPDSLRAVLRWNPAAGPIELAHLAIVGEAGDDWIFSVAVCLVASVALLAVALRVHTRYDRVFGDLL